MSRGTGPAATKQPGAHLSRSLKALVASMWPGTVAELEAAIDGADMIVPGYNGQPVAHPLLTEIRQHHLLISQTLARLKVDVPEEPGVLGVAGVNKARSAANARWRP
jgi:hypothetical protein